ncbi:bifunctional metallophosphatase/5'-nucleotidase [Secundilactobacillus kimchicus]|uniref:bifunctional metallophosphatase/5'-nucleotidase n=1 Tax=Secundilactobacillus kimchicus TaxID=528209 RepID=UPI0024A95470|nr:bifunctional metallophosphatase/5'-nucleotidase [Secundilactobacillus kimchicus]
MKLTILSTSDTHGFVFPTNYVEKGADMPFGLIRAANTIAEAQRNSTGPVVTIDDGDFLAGSPLAYYVARVHPGNDPFALTNIYNQIHYDVGVLGNHEFDYGTNYLEHAINASDRTIINANLLDRAGRPLMGQRYRIIERDGVRIGIIGLTTKAVVQWKNRADVHDVHYRSAVSVASELVPFLRPLVDVLIISYHGGFERDLETGKLLTSLSTGENEAYQLLQEVPGIDALITGHQHRRIATRLFGVPVTQPGYRGEAVGKITLDLEPTSNQRYTVIGGQAELLDASQSTYDPAILTQSKALDTTVDNWLSEPLATITGDMTFDRAEDARITETAYTEFIQKIQMETMGADLSATSIFNNEGHGFENPITMRNIMTNYVYPDGLALSEISGKDLKQALEQTAHYFILSNHQIVVNPAYYTPKLRHYNYDMYEGVDYTINVAKPMGHRIEDLTYQGRPVEDSQHFTIALNRYRAGGGGHYHMFKADKIIAENKTPMSQIIADYLRRHPQVNATVNHNFKVIATADDD